MAAPDFAEWRKQALENALRLRQDLERQQERLRKLGALGDSDSGRQQGIRADALLPTSPAEQPKEDVDEITLDTEAPLSNFPAVGSREDRQHHQPSPLGSPRSQPQRDARARPSKRTKLQSTQIASAATDRKSFARLNSTKTPYDLSQAEIFSLRLQVRGTTVFSGFSRDGLFRRASFAIFTSLHWKVFQALAILVNTVSIAYGADATKEKDLKNFDMPRSLWIDFLCTAVLFLDIFLGAVALGFYGGPGTWLRCSRYHQLDFAVLLTSAANLSLSWVFGQGDNLVEFTLRPLRLVQIFKVLTVFRHLSYIRRILKTYRDGAELMISVLAMLLFTILLFASLGISIFRDRPRFGLIGKCLAVQRMQPACASDFASNWSAASGCAASSSESFSLVESQELVISAGFPFYYTCDVARLEDDAAKAVAAAAKERKDRLPPGWVVSVTGAAENEWGETYQGPVAGMWEFVAANTANFTCTDARIAPCEISMLGVKTVQRPVGNIFLPEATTLWMRPLWSTTSIHPVPPPPPPSPPPPRPPGAASTKDAYNEPTCLTGPLVMGEQVVGQQECRFVSRSLLTRLNAASNDRMSASLLGSKFSHWNHIAGGFLAVLQYVFPDAAYDVLNSSYYSNFDMRLLILVLFLLMTFTVSLLLQGLFIAVVTGTFRSGRKKESRDAIDDPQHVRRCDLPDYAVLPKGSSIHDTGSIDHFVQDNDDTRKIGSAGSRGRIAWAEDEQSTRDTVTVAGKSFGEGAETKGSSLYLTECATEEKQDFIDDQQNLKRDLKAILKLREWNFLYASIIGVQAVLLSMDTWETSRFWHNVFRLYHGMAQLFFASELTALWVTREDRSRSHFSQIGPSNLDEISDDETTIDDGEVQDDVAGIATVVLKVLLLFSGFVGVITEDHVWTHTQALRIFWPALLVLPVLRSLLHSAFNSLLSILNLVLFALVLMLCWCCVGRYVFDDSLEAVSRSHFGDLGTGMLTLFQLFTGDGWTNLLYKMLESADGNPYQQVLGALYLLSWFLFSSVVLSNLLVSVIVDSFNVTETITSIHNSGCFGNVFGLFPGQNKQNAPFWGFALDGPDSVFKRLTWLSPRARKSGMHSETSRSKYVEDLSRTKGVSIEDGKVVIGGKPTGLGAFKFHLKEKEHLYGSHEMSLTREFEDKKDSMYAGGGEKTERGHTHAYLREHGNAAVKIFSPKIARRQSLAQASSAVVTAPISAQMPAASDRDDDSDAVLRFEAPAAPAEENLNDVMPRNGMLVCDSQASTRTESNTLAMDILPEGGEDSREISANGLVVTGIHFGTEEEGGSERDGGNTARAVAISSVSHETGCDSNVATTLLETSDWCVEAAVNRYQQNDMGIDASKIDVDNDFAPPPDHHNSFHRDLNGAVQVQESFSKRNRSKIFSAGRADGNNTDIRGEFSESQTTHGVKVMDMVHRLETYAGSEILTEKEKRDKAFFVMSEKNIVRRIFVFISLSDVFRWFLLSCVLVSCAVVLATPPFGEASKPSQFYVLSETQLDLAELVFNIIFTVEAFVLVMARGFVLGKKAYLRDPWCQFDFALVLLSWVDWLEVIPQGYDSAKSLRLLRVLKPLRVIKFNRGMRDVVNALIAVFIPLSYVLMFLAVLILAFSIIAVGVFGGKLSKCSNPIADFPLGKAQCAGMYVLGAVETAAGRQLESVHSGFVVPNVWAPPRENFDSVGSAFLTLSQCVLFKWMNPMLAVKDMTDVHMSPLQNANSSSAIFFVVFITVCGFFGFNLVLAFVVDAYNVSKDEDDADKMFGRFLRQIDAFRPQFNRGELPANRCSSFFRRILYSQTYTNIVFACICMSGIFMLAIHSSGHGDALPDDHSVFERVMTIQSHFFTAELFMEVCLALVALGPWAFFSKGWMVFDFVIVSGMIIGMVGQYSAFKKDDKLVLAYFGSITQNLRVLRVLRILTFLKLSRSIVRTLISCLPKLANVLMLVVLFYSVISAIAVQWFGMVRYGSIVGPTVSLENFQQAIYLCYSCAFGGEWNEIMYDLMVTGPECTPAGNGVAYTDCGNVYQALVLMFVIKIFAEGMLVNVSIGMILDNFSFITDSLGFEQDVTWSQGPSNEQVERLAMIFRRFDNGTGYLPMTALRSFLVTAPRPLGFGEQAPDSERTGLAAAVDGEMRDLAASQRITVRFLHRFSSKDSSKGNSNSSPDDLSAKNLSAGQTAESTLNADECATYKLIRAELNVMLRQRGLKKRRSRHAEQLKQDHPHSYRSYRQFLWAPSFHANAASSSTATGAVPTANNGHSLELVDQEKASCQPPQTHRGRVTIGSQKDWIAARRARHVAPSKMGPMSSSGSSRLSRIQDWVRQHLFKIQSWLERKGFRQPSRFRKRKKQTFHAAVSFEELLIATMMWRVPWMTPSFMRPHRKDRIDEVVYMVHSLTIRDFLRTSVPKIHAEEYKKDLLVRARTLWQDIRVASLAVPRVGGLYGIDASKEEYIRSHRRLAAKDAETQHVALYGIQRFSDAMKLLLLGRRGEMEGLDVPVLGFQAMFRPLQHTQHGRTVWQGVRVASLAVPRVGELYGIDASREQYIRSHGLLAAKDSETQQVALYGIQRFSDAMKLLLLGRRGEMEGLDVPVLGFQAMFRPLQHTQHGRTVWQGVRVASLAVPRVGELYGIDASREQYIRSHGLLAAKDSETQQVALYGIQRFSDAMKLLLLGRRGEMEGLDVPVLGFQAMFRPLQHTQHGRTVWQGVRVASLAVPRVGELYGIDASREQYIRSHGLLAAKDSETQQVALHGIQRFSDAMKLLLLGRQGEME